LGVCPRCRAGYLVTVAFFNRDLGVGLIDDKEDEDQGHGDEEDGWRGLTSAMSMERDLGFQGKRSMMY
jgi:hypothetical protein